MRKVGSLAADDLVSIDKMILAEYGPLKDYFRCSHKFYIRDIHRVL